MIGNNGIFNGSLRVLGDLFSDSIVGNVTGSLNGNANTATVLKTPRLINGTSFSGGSDITTAKWGNSRTITLSGAITGTLTIDGSANASLVTSEGNVSFKRLGEVGATTDWNTLINSGCYKVQMPAWGNATTYHSPNQSGDVYSFGLLIVFKSNVTSEDRTVQIYYPNNAGNVVTRMLNSGDWQVWAPIFKGLTKSYIGLGNVDNTADSAKSVLSSTKWTNARNFTIGGVTLSVDGSKDVSCTIDQIGALSLTGGTMSGAINSSKNTGTFLAGNQGAAIINSTATAGGYVMLAKMNSTNGYFTHGSYQNKYLLQYTDKATVDAGTNSVTKSVTLLDESGNTTFPGIVTGAFSGNLNGTAARATADVFGNTIATNYVASASVSGKTILLKNKINDTLATLTTQDTLNTAGSTASNSKLFIIGATTQAANPVTNTRSTCYIGTDGCLYSNNVKVSDINHSHSYLPLTGGVLTGNLILKKGYYIHNISSGAGSGGYIQVATITITEAYVNQPFTIDVIQRSKMGKLTIYFTNASSTDPTLNSFETSGLVDNIKAYLYKSATSTWKLYIEKSEGYDNISIVDVKLGSWRSKFDIEWTDLFTTELPVGYIAATKATINQNIIGTATTANNLTYLKNTSTIDVGLDSTDSNAIGYVNNISVLGQKDGALIKQSYSSVWMAEIFMDYRTGQLASRGKNNGTLQSWRTQIDSENYTNYSPTKTGVGASGTWGISITGSSASCTGNSATATNAANATKATQDSAGNNILSSYAASLVANGTSVSLKSKSGSVLSTITTKDTLNTAGVTSSYETLFLIGAQYQAGATSSITYSTGSCYVNCMTGLLHVNGIKINDTSDGITAGVPNVDIGGNGNSFANVYASTFHGDLDGKLTTSRTIDGVNFDGSADITHYGVCSTGQGTAAKVVSLTGFVLSTGVRVSVKFTSSNTYSSPTLNVNGTGAKYIKAFSSTSAPIYYWNPGSVIDFVYDGTYWIMVAGSYATTSYYGRVKLSNEYSTADSGVGIAASQSALCSAYSLLNNKSDLLACDIVDTGCDYTTASSLYIKATMDSDGWYKTNPLVDLSSYGIYIATLSVRVSANFITDTNKFTGGIDLTLYVSDGVDTTSSSHFDFTNSRYIEMSLSTIVTTFSKDNNGASGWNDNMSFSIDSPALASKTVNIYYNLRIVKLGNTYGL